MSMTIQSRRRILINTDPQRRCYNGCHFSSELVWSEWEVLNYNVTEDSVQDKLKFWRELGDYAVSQRGESARSEFRAVQEEEEAVLLQGYILN